MPEAVKTRKFRHSGRFFQIPIYLGKRLRGFIYEMDWKVFPMAAIVAALVAMVVRKAMFVTMEGTLMGSFALVCVSIWNGCFNSIQVICRERGIIKREHRSGMHISSYIFSHMLYQAFLCFGQTIITLYVCKYSGMKFPAEGFMTGSLIIEIGISIFLITYAADMLSLLISAIAHTTTAAMTVMPFILIFQLVFSGGFFSLPERARPFSNLTISNYGLKAIAAQADYNHLPMSTGWNTVLKMKGETLTGTITVGQMLDLLQQEDKALIHEIRATEIRKDEIYGITLQLLGGDAGALLLPGVENMVSDETITLGDVIDTVAADPAVIENREQTFTTSIRIADVIDLIGEENAKRVIEEKSASASVVPAYERTKSNIITSWLQLAAFTALYALLAVIVLEFIDKDKR